MILVYYITKIKNKCPPPEIKYKYISRDVENDEFLKENPSVSFRDMFNLGDVWSQAFINQA